MSSGERGVEAKSAIIEPREAAARVRAAFGGVRFIHIKAHDRGGSLRVESWMSADRIKSVGHDKIGAIVGAVLAVNGRVTEVSRDGRRVEYDAEPGVIGVAFPKLLDDDAHHALADYLESWVTPQTDDDAPTWFIDAIARGAWRGREAFGGRECLVFDDVHAQPHRRVTHTVRIDAATMLPTSITTTGNDVKGERTLDRVYDTFEVFAQDPGWEWKLDDQGAT